MFIENSRVIFSFNPLALFGSLANPRPKTLRPLSTSQRNAFHTVQMLARKHYRALATDAGDMHFINNLAVLHAREHFEDSEDTFRHIIRMNLRNGEWGWDLPQSLSAQWRRPIGARDQVWTIDPADIQYLHNVCRLT